MIKRNITAIATMAMALASAMPTMTSMAQGWEQLTNGDWTYTDSNGNATCDTWQLSNGKYYYINSEGVMAKNALIADGSNYYYVDEDGARVTNTWKDCIDDADGETYRFYFTSSGKAKESGYETIDGVKYHFTDFHLDTGFSEDNKYYYGTDEMNDLYKQGWHFINDNENNENFTSGWYYTDNKGQLVKDQEKKIDGKYYLFNADGLMCDQWCEIVTNDGVVSKYYHKGSGARADGWIFYEGDDTQGYGEVFQGEGYYYLVNGRPYTSTYQTTSIGNGFGVKKINGKTYCFDAAGVMQSGIVYGSDGKIYYFGDEKDGAMKTGRVLVEHDPNYGYEGTYMYFNTAGSYSTGKGSDVTGIQNGYLYDEGELVKSDDSWAYIEISNGNSYVVNESGRVKKSGNVEIDGVKYTISEGENGYKLTKV